MPIRKENRADSLGDAAVSSSSPSGAVKQLSADAQRDRRRSDNATLNKLIATTVIIGFLSFIWFTFGVGKGVDHFHEIILSASLWFSLQFISTRVSRAFFTNTYGKMTFKNQVNWDIRVVSTIHATGVSVLCLYMIAYHKELKDDRVFGYTKEAGRLAAIAAGYFLYDTTIVIWHYDLYGASFLVHGVLCFILYMGTHHPWLLHYGPLFLLWEISTPFLNFHWWFDKLKMSGSRLQLINGLVFMVLFFLVRICFGFYTYFHYVVDILDAIKSPRGAADDFVQFAGPFYIGACLISNLLNVYWFSAMIRSLRSRMNGSPKAE